MRFLLTVVVLTGVGAGGGWAYLRYHTPWVHVTDVVEGPVVQAFYATGTLQPDREFAVKANVEGILTQMLVDKGTCVNKGQKLAVVSADDLQLRYRQAEADLALKNRLADDGMSPALGEFDSKLKAANEQLDIVKRELERVKDLRENKVASQADYDRANERVQEAWSIVESIKGQRATRKLELERDVKVAQAALDIAQWNLDQQTIKAPIDGVVLDRPVSAGTRVRVNEHLMQIADVQPANLVMRAAVDEEDKVYVKIGQKVRVALYSYQNGKPFEGEVKTIYPRADADRRTFEVDVAIAKADAGFSAGMTGELAFIIDAKAAATVIPSQAVQDGAVWVVQGKKLSKAHVTLGLKSVERTEVIAGLRPGEQVVVSPIMRLKAGQAVETQYVDPITAAGLNKTSTEDEVFKGGGA